MNPPVFVLAPDSFKESISAQQACAALEKGIKKVFPEAVCHHVPMADGGEGTMHALVEATGGKIFNARVTGPLGSKVDATYGILGDGITGVLEMASASGLQLVKPEERNPLITTTYGTGEIIKMLLGQGVKKLVIGIGGSATNDGGAGIAQALGAKLTDKNGNEIKPGGGNLGLLEKIDPAEIKSLLDGIEVEVACDVTNPLTGPKGASAIYGPQKGATQEMVAQLDANLQHYAAVIRKQLGKEIEFTEGSGAAGGTGAGLMAFLNAKLVKGIDLVIKYSGLEAKVKEADYVFTGEGSVDHQTAFGKTISGIAGVTKKYNKPLIAFAGKVGEIDNLYETGVSAVFGILPTVCNIDEALLKGDQNLEKEAEQVCRLIRSRMF